MGVVVDVRDIRAARAALGWTWHELAKRSGLAVRTVARVEAGKGSPESVEAVVKALKAGGVTFLQAKAQGRGIRYKPK